MGKPQWSKRPLDELDAEQLAAYERRRAQLLEAARAVVSRLGDDFTMADVAREAGLGMSSVYRTFSSKEDLLIELLHARKQQWLTIWQRAEARDDAGPALVDAMWEFAELEHRDLGLAAALRDLAFSRRDLVTETESIGQRVLARAQAVGAIRADAEYRDVLRIFHMLSSLADEREWRRGLALYLDGMRAAGEPLVGREAPGASVPAGGW
ncbi:TetR/AcrR family transcriptional regulator [Conexibacter sp. CPCC 206217]|uniref:TetR/AcrR family transcriptional regulator n=1 Tax=Conexibacter sp. CPCC 206217 TaxID=3064574 RepID=UPI002725B222|nr:TetR/AcrR family transcriptional regulator [Conexibacter sp. CPCC 206217]MDO8212634.1 helix-turn-helix domain-containing protein [Conexibacter sp. CPCC 206217]